MFFRKTLIAGLIAGTVATAFELAVWWLIGMPLPETLFRDTRLAAAILLGPETIAAPLSAAALLVATVIHFGLSIAYAALFALLLRRLPTPSRASLFVAGAAFGLAIYLINMHAFTAIFPWFAVVRDATTLSAHLVFGVSLAAALCWRAHKTKP